MGKMKFGGALLAVAASVALASTVSAEEVKGKVKAISKSSSTIALEVEQKGVVVFKFDPSTQFKNAKAATDIIADEVVTVDYAVTGAENRAKSITKVIAPPPEGVKRITIQELEALIGKGPKQGNYQLIDSRPPGKYNEGHIPTAVSIPFSELDKQGEKLLPGDKAKTLVFYCGGLSCVLSPKSAVIARKLGYQDVRMFPEGEPGWKRADLATESTAAFVKSGNIVLIDLRTADKVELGHIPRAVNIPFAKLAYSEKLFPAYKGAQIVVYSDRETDLPAALEQLRDWGYTNPTIYPGGVTAWQAGGNDPAKGAAATTIAYQRKLAPGEVSIKEFSELAKSGSVQIVDVRSAEEFGKGHLANAINIPAEEMARRFVEMPAGKPLLIHCSTGTRAEMAYDILKEKGVQTRYLKAAVEFKERNPVYSE